MIKNVLPYIYTAKHSLSIEDWCTSKLRQKKGTFCALKIILREHSFNFIKNREEIPALFTFILQKNKNNNRSKKKTQAVDTTSITVPRWHGTLPAPAKIKSKSLTRPHRLINRNRPPSPPLPHKPNQAPSPSPRSNPLPPPY